MISIIHTMRYLHGIGRNIACLWPILRLIESWNDPSVSYLSDWHIYCLCYNCQCGILYLESYTTIEDVRFRIYIAFVLKYEDILLLCRYDPLISIDIPFVNYFALFSPFIRCIFVDSILPFSIYIFVTFLVNHSMESWGSHDLTQWSWNKMANILQLTYSI